MKKKRITPTSSPFWTPKKAGDELKGKFQAFQSTLYGGAIKLDSGLIGLSTVLKNLFRSVAPKMKQGDTVRIVYTGKGKGQRGHPSMIYDAYLNGKQLEGTFKAVKGADLDKLFEGKGGK